MSYKRFLRPALAVAAVIGVGWAGVALAAPGKSHENPAPAAIAPLSADLAPSAEPSPSPTKAPTPSPTRAPVKKTTVAPKKTVSAAAQLATVIR
jgi:hypothetical protein